jgi:DNA-binding ferritin-like protein (Dps family)
MKLISDSSIAVSKIEDGSILLVDVQAYNRSLDYGSECPHFILSKEAWKETRNRILKSGIVGLNGVSNLDASLSTTSSILLKQESVKLELNADQVDAFCEALIEDKFEYKNIPQKKFVSIEPTFMIKR